MVVKKSAPMVRRTRTDVETYMRELNHPYKHEMQALRKIILGVDAKITEEIKWNAPSFALGQHFLTFNGWAKDYVQLIFHHGAKKAAGRGKPIDDPNGLLEWLAKDRASIRFDSMKEVRSKKAGLQKIVKLWIKAMGKS
jgi:hypothetical protein